MSLIHDWPFWHTQAHMPGKRRRIAADILNCGHAFFDFEPPDPYPDNIYGLRGRQRFHTIGFQGLPVPDWLLRELPLAVRARRGMYRVYSKAGLITHCAATPGMGVRRAPQSGRHGVDSRCLKSLSRWSFGGRSCEWRLPLLLVLLY
jgi:hypothetical protein